MSLVINKNSTDSILSYCLAEFCEGLPLDADYEKIEEDIECPVCYESLNSGKISLLSNCRHFFCSNCIRDLDNKNVCPMCRETFEGTITLNVPVSCSIVNCKKIMDGHHSCLLNFPPIMKEYVADLNEEWKSLIKFMVKSQVFKSNYVGVGGVEHINLNKYEVEGTILSRGGCFAIIKEKHETAKVIAGCYLPCMSLRLVILPDDDSDIGQDNEYADEAVGYMNKQLEACWRVFPRLINKGIDHMLVRKFKNVTCYLLLTGNIEGLIPGNHFIPMKEQLRNLKVCNFNANLLDGLRRSKFPVCNYKKCGLPREYKDYDCCKAK